MYFVLSVFVIVFRRKVFWVSYCIWEHIGKRDKKKKSVSLSEESSWIKSKFMRHYVEQKSFVYSKKKNKIYN